MRSWRDNYTSQLTRTREVQLPSTVDFRDIGSGQIGSDQIYGQAITEAQLADGSISSAKIGTISADDITTGTLDASAVTVSNLNASNITTGSLSVDRLTNSSITGSKIASSTIAGSNISGGTITGANIAGGTITGSNIAAGTISASNIAAGTITANELAANSVGASEIIAGSVSAAKISANTITGSQITTGLLETVSQFVSGGVAIGGGARSVSGLDVVGTKSWIMDHPLKEGYDLRHACVEGPEPADFYRGRITYGEKITLPDYVPHIHKMETLQVFLSGPIPGLIWEYTSNEEIEVKSVLENLIMGIKKEHKYIDWLVIVERDIPFEVEHKRTEDEELLRELGAERYNEIKEEELKSEVVALKKGRKKWYNIH